MYSWMDHAVVHNLVDHPSPEVRHVLLCERYRRISRQILRVFEREHPAIGAVHLPRDVLDIFHGETGSVVGLLLLVHALVLEVFDQHLEDVVLVTAHGVVEVDALLPEINHGQAPMNVQVHGNEYNVEGKDVNLPRPPPDCGVTGSLQLGIEEGVGRVDIGPVVVRLRSLHDHLEVEIDDLVVEPVEAPQGVQVLAGDRDVVGVDERLVARRRQVRVDLPLHVLRELGQFSFLLLWLGLRDGDLGQLQVVSHPILHRLGQSFLSFPTVVEANLFLLDEHVRILFTGVILLP